MTAQADPGNTAGDPPRFLCGLASEALLFAAEAHRGQRLKGGYAFIVHPLEVLGLMWAAGAQQEEVLAAAALHDVLERTTTTDAELAQTFGEGVRRIVRALTQDPTISSYEERKAALRAQAIGAGEDARLVFAADKISKSRLLRAAIAARDGAPSRKQAARLAHYLASLDALRAATPAARLVDVLELELWPLRSLAKIQAG